MNRVAPGKARRRRLSPLTVIGELLLVAGIAVLGFIVWQPWYVNLTVGAKQTTLTAEDSAKWEENFVHDPNIEGVPAVARPAEGEVFGVLHVPAFGKTYTNRVAEGTNRDLVLDLDEKGIGRYADTSMPGEPGNTAWAAHRSGSHTQPFREIMNLRIGDPLFLETEQGWYTYRYRSAEYVDPSEVDVLNPFPRREGAAGDDQILTLTSCHPKHWGAYERVIAYSVLEDFQPRNEGPPAELLELNPELKG